MEHSIDIEDLEAFIDGLKHSIDSLEGTDPLKSHGFQAQLAKTISALRIKKISKIELPPKLSKIRTKEDLKNFLLKQLVELKNLLDANDNNQRKKFELVKKIVDLRAEISRI